MIRRLVASCVLSAAMGIAVTVAGQGTSVTFVLTDGQRVSGQLTYKGGTVYTLNGRDYPSDDVAVIAFAGADPPAAELRQLPTAVTREHERDMFVMRDGSVTLGKLYHIEADGSRILFDPLGGTSAADRRTVPSSQIARIYINAPKARAVYASVLNAEPPKDTPAPPPAERGQTIVVEANRDWTDTGIDVRRGQPIIFRTTGEIQLGGGRTTSAEGVESGGLNPSRFPVRGMRRGRLIGRVGNSAPFSIGVTQEPIRMPAAGRLLLGINDLNHANNSGAFRVVVEP